MASWTRVEASTQTNFYTAHAGIQFQPNVAALQIEHDSFAVLEPDSRHATSHGGACPDSGVSAGDVGSPTQVAGAAYQLGLRRSNRCAKTQAADPQRVVTSVEDKRPPAASNTDDKSCLQNFDVNCPGFGPRRYRQYGGYQRNCHYEVAKSLPDLHH